MTVKQDKVGDATLHEGNAAETFGNEQVRVDVGEPFVISRSTDYHWFPTLHQVSPRELLVNFWCSPDEINPAGTRTAYCWTSDSGKTFGPPVPQGDAGHSFCCFSRTFGIGYVCPFDNNFRIGYVCCFDRNFRNGSSPPTEAVLWCRNNKKVSNGQELEKQQDTLFL
jgi:hypothetical protein